MRSKLSIALATFNGVEFLQQQLDSILAQDRLPDEVVACDDASHDATYAVLENFRKQAPFPVRLEKNKVNLGFAKNFELAIGLCTGDIVFPCDQDDVWDRRKLQVAEDAFAGPDKPDLFFSDAEVVNAALGPLLPSLWVCVGFGWRKRLLFARGEAWRVLVRQSVVTGATMAFRADLRRWLLPIPAGLAHDGWISLATSVLGTMHPCAQRLVKYRIHDRNTIGMGEKLRVPSLLNRALADPSRRVKIQSDIAGRYRYYHGALSRFPASDKGMAARRYYEDGIRHKEIRAHLPRNFPLRLLVVAREFIRMNYFRFGGGLTGVGADLFRVPRG